MRDSAVPLREESDLRDQILLERLETIVPLIMRRTGIDCWVLIAREYNEDPVVRTMLPPTWITARRRTILVFTESGTERVAISRYAVGEAFPSAWSPEDQPDQWQRLADYLDERSPKRIAINRSPEFAHADGIAATDAELLMQSLPSHLASRVVGTSELAVAWLETRSSAELDAYPDVCARAHRILRRALSPEVITPAQTTTEDVVWWLRQTVIDSGYRTWFQPTVSIQRAESELAESVAAQHTGQTIERGDLIHIDFGIEYLGLHTDQQQHAYVLREGELEAPAGLRTGLTAANRLQDLVMEQFHEGRTGNEILGAARTAAAREGLRPTIYSHPIGAHGHGAGPTIGLWDQQAGVPGAGDYPLWPDTAYSIELSVLYEVPEWGGNPVRFMLEEDAVFDGRRIEFLDGRQTDLWLI